MRLLYLKANGKYYRPQLPYEEWNEKTEIQKYKSVCYITELSLGTWQIDYYDQTREYTERGGYKAYNNPECEPNTRLILYPFSIQEICYDF
jgi:hypothetical protein